MDDRGLNVAWLVAVANCADRAMLAAQCMEQCVIRLAARTEDNTVYSIESVRFPVNDVVCLDAVLSDFPDARVSEQRDLVIHQLFQQVVSRR